MIVSWCIKKPIRHVGHGNYNMIRIWYFLLIFIRINGDAGNFLCQNNKYEYIPPYKNTSLIIKKPCRHVYYQNNSSMAASGIKIT